MRTRTKKPAAHTPHRKLVLLRKSPHEIVDLDRAQHTSPPGMKSKRRNRKGAPPRAAHEGERLIHGIHELRRTLVEDAFYPPHAPRKESNAYASVHRALVIVEDTPCFICGVRQSTLGSPAHNPFRAQAIETHHVHVEWALASAVDLAKFNAQIVAKLRRERPGDPAYAKDFTRPQMLAWIDHSRDNLLVLCDVHHRHAFVGIHAITGPIWGAQNLLVRGLVGEEKKLARK